MENKVERVTAADIESLPDQVLQIYREGSKFTMGRLKELEEMEEWERAIQFNSSETDEVIYDNKDIIKANHQIITSVAFKKEFGEIYYN